LETWNLHFSGCVPEGAFLSFLPELSSLTQFRVSWFAFYLCFRIRISYFNRSSCQASFMLKLSSEECPASSPLLCGC
jgi:hypothetical protein